MKIAPALVLACALSGCAAVKSFETGVSRLDTAALAAIETGENYLGRANAALVRRQPTIQRAAALCVVAEGYVRTIHDATGRISDAVLADAQRAAAVCKAIAESPNVTVGSIAAAIGQQLLILQNAAQLPKR